MFTNPLIRVRRLWSFRLLLSVFFLNNINSFQSIYPSIFLSTVRSLPLDGTFWNISQNKNLNLAEPFTFYAPYHMSGLKLCIGLFHDCRDSDCHNNLSLYSSMYFFNLFIVLIIILSRFNAVPAISEVLCNTFFFLYSKSF